MYVCMQEIKGGSCSCDGDGGGSDILIEKINDWILID